ncbi:hypothetical protein [Bartonella sp. B1098]|nr:hypothetical protein [Bartonella sp. B1098]
MRASSFALPVGEGQFALNEFGYGNQLLLDEKALLGNLRAVQAGQ